MDPKMTWLLGQVNASKLQGSVGKPLVTTKDFYICYDEESVGERQERVRGCGSLSQTERLIVMTAPGTFWKVA